MDTKKLVIPPIYLLISAIAMIWLNYIYPFIHIFKGNIRYMGFLVAGIGIAIILLAINLFNKADTPYKPFEKPEQLVTGGIYRFTRNPMYLGMVIILSGLGILLGGLSAFLVIPLFIWAIHNNFILLEEQLLLNSFGKDYADYLSRVGRWI